MLCIELGLGRIGYLENFKVFGFESLSGRSIILLFLSGSGVLGYPDVGYPYKICNIRRISRFGYESLK